MRLKYRYLIVTKDGNVSMTNNLGLAKSKIKPYTVGLGIGNTHNRGILIDASLGKEYNSENDTWQSISSDKSSSESLSDEMFNASS